MGLHLNFFRWEGEPSVTHVPTKGRVTNRVGFEVKNLGRVCGTQSQVKLATPYRKAAGSELGWRRSPMGRVIELTEGLDKVL